MPWCWSQIKCALGIHTCAHRAGAQHGFTENHSRMAEDVLMIDLCSSDDPEPSVPPSGPTDSGIEIIMMAAGPSGPSLRPSAAAGPSSANPPAGSSAFMDDVVITGDSGQVRGLGGPHMMGHDPQIIQRRTQQGICLIPARTALSIACPKSQALPIHSTVPR